MELGNIIFGNSRGNFEVNRDLVDSEEWQYLVHTLLQVEDYHCSIGEYYEDYSTTALRSIKRTNNLKPNEYGGYTCIHNGKKIFEIMPYWWGDCTCGVEDENFIMEENLRKEIFTKEELNIYDSYESYCDNKCSAASWKEENKNKTNDELLKICTCGQIAKNINILKKKKKIENKIKKFNEEFNFKYKEHKSSCMYKKHNFVYYENDEEFQIDWYKYPFRDAYMNINLNDAQIKEIFKECAEILKKVIIENKGTWKEFDKD